MDSSYRHYYIGQDVDVIPRTKANYSLTDLLRSLFVKRQSGKFRKKLINELKRITGEQNLLLMPSGRGALYFLLKALPQKRAIIPAYTCSAVAEAALLAGKDVAYVDIAKNSYNMDVELLEGELTSDSIVIVTHQFGIPCKIERLCEKIKNAGAFAVEDMAGAFGGCYAGRRLGSFGDAAFFSFDTTKLISVPMKAGFLTVKDGNLSSRIRELCHNELKQMPLSKALLNSFKSLILLLIENGSLYHFFHWLVFGSRGKFTAETGEVGSELDEFYCFEMSEQQAYIALRQLSNFDEIVEQRRKLWWAYYRALSGAKTFLVPDIGSGDPNEWACIRFPILVRGEKIQFYKRAAQLGVDFAFSFSHLSCDQGEKRAWSIANHVLDLPFYHKLSARELRSVITVLKKLDEEYFHEICSNVKNEDESREHL